jgi:hypothetical protein
LLTPPSPTTSSAAKSASPVGAVVTTRSSVRRPASPGPRSVKGTGTR